jgi:hypothetical protein
MAVSAIELFWRRMKLFYDPIKTRWALTWLMIFVLATAISATLKLPERFVCSGSWGNRHSTYYCKYNPFSPQIWRKLP